MPSFAAHTRIACDTDTLDTRVSQSDGPGLRRSIEVLQLQLGQRTVAVGYGLSARGPFCAVPIPPDDVYGTPEEQQRHHEEDAGGGAGYDGPEEAEHYPEFDDCLLQ